jgi:hypothetical protein
MFCPLINGECKEDKCMLWIEQKQLGWTNACAIWLLAVRGKDAYEDPIPPERREW